MCKEVPSSRGVSTDRSGGPPRAGHTTSSQPETHGTTGGKSDWIHRADQLVHSRGTGEEAPVGVDGLAAVVTAVSDFVDCSPLDLEPLSRYVDPEALDRFVDSPNHLERHLRVEFALAGCNVEVTRFAIDVGCDSAATRN